MTRAEALKHLRVMPFAVQKAHSNLTEGVGDDEIGQEVNAVLAPWLFGPRCVRPFLVKYPDRGEAGAPINGADFCNFMTITARTPATALAAMANEGVLPEPELA